MTTSALLRINNHIKILATYALLERNTLINRILITTKYVFDIILIDF